MQFQGAIDALDRGLLVLRKAWLTPDAASSSTTPIHACYGSLIDSSGRLWCPLLVDLKADDWEIHVPRVQGAS